MKLLAVLIFLITTPVIGFAQADSTAAQRAVAEQRFSDARVIYARLSEREPQNVGHIVWIARLSAWLKEYDSAMKEYDRALLMQPDNVDALIGRAYVHMWMHSKEAAAHDLDAAANLNPSSADLKMARARFLYYQEKWDDAARSLRSLLLQEPGNKEAQELKARLATGSRFELRIGAGHEELTGGPASNAGYVAARWYNRRSSVSLNYEIWNKFGENSNRAGVLFQRRIADAYTLTAGAMFAPRSNVLAHEDLVVSLRKNLPRGFSSSLEYRYLGFKGASVHIVSPTVSYHFEKPIVIEATYHRSATNIANSPSASNGSFQVSSYYTIRRKLTLQAGYLQGSESYSLASVDRLGSFRSKSLQFASELSLTEKRSFGFSYSRQQRSNGTIQHGFGVSIILRK